MNKEDERKVMISRREEDSQRIRKQKRLEVIQKSRDQFAQNENEDIFKDQSVNILNGQQTEYNNNSDRAHLQDDKNRDQIQILLEKKYNVNDLLELVQRLKQSEDILIKIDSAIGIRKILSDEDNCPIQQVIDMNGVIVLLQNMTNQSQPHLQLECAWALTNIVCGNTHQVKAVVQQNAIKFFIQLLHNRYPIIADQAIWALGNIAGDSHLYRDLILKDNAVVQIKNLVLNKLSTKNCVYQGIWALSNLCRGRPLPDYELCKDAIEVFCWGIKNIKNYQILSDAAWALSYLSDGDDKRIQKILDTNVCPFLVEYLTNPMVSLQIPALRTLGNLMTGTDNQTDIVIKSGVVPQLFNMLQNTDNPAIRREIMWTISNIAAGTPNQISVILQPGYIQQIQSILENEISQEVLDEALFLLKNILIKGNQHHIQVIYQSLFVKSLVILLQNQSESILIKAIQNINKLFFLGQNILFINNQNLFLQQFAQFNGISYLEKLQTHPSEQVYIEVSKIIQEFFDVDQEQF